MARLKVIKNQQPVSEILLEQGQTYLAGRGESCQIRMDSEPGISRNHFQISFVDNQWKVEVLSRYGELYIKGEKAPGLMSLTEPTKFSVPPYDFEFDLESKISEGAIQNNSGATLERTVVSNLPSIAYIKMLDNTGNLVQVFKLEGDAWVAGRDVSCSIFIDNPQISRRQFELYKENEQFFIRDLASVNGTIVNGEVISAKDWSPLNSADVITVNDWTLHFEIRDAEFDQRVDDVKTEFKKVPVIEVTQSRASIGAGSLSQSEEVKTQYDNIPVDSGIRQQQQQQFVGNFPQVGNYQQSSNYGGQAGYQGGYQQAGGPPPPPPLGKFDEFKAKMNPVRMAIILLALGALIYGMFFNDSKSTSPKSAQKKVSEFDKLSPSDKKFVEETYRAAEQYLLAKNYQSAYDEIQKMKTKIKVYKDSKTIEDTAQQALAMLEQMRKEEEDQRRKAEIEEKIAKQVDQCRSTMDPEKVEVSDIENCLSSVIPFNPVHERITGLKREVENLIAERAARQLQEKAYRDDVKKLQALYAKAVATEKKDHLLQAIKDYEIVVNAKLPDPKKLRAAAKLAVQRLSNKIRNDQITYIKQAEKSMAESKFKDAVVVLQKALRINPNEPMVKTKLETAFIELKKQMQLIFHESVIEEGVGEVEIAKGKWRKIIDNSLPTEEYYEKSRLKLKKYGVL